MLSRRELLGRFTKVASSTKEAQSFVPLPPYNFNRSLFSKFCLDCPKDCVEACSEVCKEGILKIFEGIPYVDFTQEGCLLCQECAKVCSYDVLELKEKSNPNWNFKIEISADKCLAYHKTLCNTCKDICIGVNYRKDIIVFAGLFYPEITENCTNCGFCISVCPTYAIVLTPKKEEINN